MPTLSYNFAKSSAFFSTSLSFSLFATLFKCRKVGAYARKILGEEGGGNAPPPEYGDNGHIIRMLFATLNVQMCITK